MPVNSTHPDYDASEIAWLRARDVFAGEDAVKSGRERYLPRLDAQTNDEYPVVLVEYGSGRRCGRHRKLRELLEAGSGKVVGKICPSDLRLGKATFESIASDVQMNPALGTKLASLIGLKSAGSGFKQSPKSPASAPKRPPQPIQGGTPSIT